MDSNPAATGGADAQEDDRIAEEEEGVVTIKEYVDGLEAQELEVDMILGGDDGKECTYPKGYLPRQAVFSCITCCPDGNAGVCTACSMNCHDGHEVIEIWTRRHFRCDCGNSKFGIGACKLFSSKDPENDENVYNKNYKGVYCTCNRPYPDPDAAEDMGEMLQCCVCEDWFHEAHLGLASTEEVPRDEEGEPIFEEVICQACAIPLDFLSCYRSLLVPIISSNSPCKEEQHGEVLSAAALAASKGSTDERVEVSETSEVVQNYSQNAEKASSSDKNALQPQTSDVLGKESMGEKSTNGVVMPSITEFPERVEVSETSEVVQNSSQNAGKASSSDKDAFQPQTSDVLGKESMGEKSTNGVVIPSITEFPEKELMEPKLATGGVIHCNGTQKHSDCSTDCSNFCILISGEASGSIWKGSKVSDSVEGQNTLSHVWTDKALFLKKGWRSQLCRCTACLEMYAKKGVSFLMDPDDTIAIYEEVAKQKRKEKMDANSGRDLSFLNNMSHVGKIEFLHGLNEMTTELSAFFASCESGKAITSADIYEVFENLKKKRARHE